MDGMIKAAKDLLDMCISTEIPDATVVRNRGDESKQVMTRKWPLVSLITQAGRLDDRTARLARYRDDVTGELKQRRIRGTRIIPILIGVWAKGENEVDEVFSKIDMDNSCYAMELFKEIGLQMILVTPMDKINIVEDYIASVHITEKQNDNTSRLLNITIDRYQKEKERVTTSGIL